MENPPFQFPMDLTIRCYQCGKVFDVAVTSRDPHEFPCPVCGKVEVFDLGEMERKAIAKQEKMSRQSGGRQ
jgi:phage FluMu protein Com